MALAVEATMMEELESSSIALYNFLPIQKLSLGLHFDEYVMVKIRVLESVQSYPCQNCVNT